ncbi:hypothetical protein ACFRQM_04470 [Streptomyces sp. NPDC056831]|uniref:hypothetical protein n=1 Tax=Streptomyces sp. NPDC056831 TaxID=3345954 RepID=UPI00369FCB71
MKPAAVLLAAAALLALTACSAEEKDVTKPAPTKSVDHSAAEKAAGIPPAPTGNDRAAYLAAIKKVDPRIVEDEEKAIDAGRNQCASLAGDSKMPDWAAAQRFGNDTRPLTDAQGKQLNEALRKTLCPK